MWTPTASLLDLGTDRGTCIDSCLDPRTRANVATPGPSDTSCDTCGPKPHLFVSGHQGPVSRSLPWKGPPLVKEGGFFSFGKATLKFSFTKLPLILLTKGLP